MNGRCMGIAPMNHGSGVNGFGPWGSRTESCIGQTSIIPRCRRDSSGGISAPLILGREGLRDTETSYGYSRVRYRGCNATPGNVPQADGYNLRLRGLTHHATGGHDPDGPTPDVPHSSQQLRLSITRHRMPHKGLAGAHYRYLRPNVRRQHGYSKVSVRGNDRMTGVGRE